jgi:hypothetical protein
MKKSLENYFAILETKEGTFILNTERGIVREGNDLPIHKNRFHFAIDCACKGDGVRYKGYHYRNDSVDIKSASEESRGDHNFMEDAAVLFKHTYYLNEELFSIIIERTPLEFGRRKPLIIVCEDCGREFSFTPESYLDLRRKILSLNEKPITSS